jgi:hypothetical protein
MNIGKKRMLSEINNTKLAPSAAASESKTSLGTESKQKVVNAFQMMMGGFLKKNKENVPEA